MQKRIFENSQFNRLFVVSKPMFISSNFYLNKIKLKYKNKKAGFSGTLDPFAKGCLIVAFGQYAKLFKYLAKTPKVYKAVIWLGVQSESFDIERIEKIGFENRLYENFLREQILSLKGEISYIPPKFSAKRVNGLKAYELAREGLEFDMKSSTMQVFDIKLLKYNHPFISIEATVSEGSYIRSLAQILLQKINKVGTLSYLERLKEGDFIYENEKELNPIDYMNLPKIKYFGSKEWLEIGKRLSINYLEHSINGRYIIDCEDFFSIIEIDEKKVKYLLNKIPKLG